MVTASSPSLLDVVTGPPVTGDYPLTGEDRVRIVNEVIASLLHEHAHIEEIDTFGPRQKSRRSLTRPHHLVFRRLHEDWLARADALWPHVESMRDDGRPVARLPELRHAMLLTRGFLKLTVEEIEAGMEEIRQGKCHTYASVEDLRREVRAERERRRAGDTDDSSA